MQTKLPYLDQRAFRSVRSYYFRDAVSKSWGLTHVGVSETKLADLRPLYRAAHLLALDWYQRRYI